MENTKNDGPYSPDNCCWVTPHFQSRNKRNNKIITWMGETKILKDWSDDLGIHYDTLKYRIKAGYSLDEVFQNG
jgi:hypothetical protein